MATPAAEAVIELCTLAAPFTADVQVWRADGSGDEPAGRVCTNVPHSCVLHSPVGFDCGYEGKGPADLALNILNAFYPPRSELPRTWYEIFHDDDPHVTLRGFASRFALRWHQDFKLDFIAPMKPSGGRIHARAIKRWILEHRSRP